MNRPHRHEYRRPPWEGVLGTGFWGVAGLLYCLTGTPLGLLIGLIVGFLLGLYCGG